MPDQSGSGEQSWHVQVVVPSSSVYGRPIAPMGSSQQSHRGASLTFAIVPSRR